MLFPILKYTFVNTIRLARNKTVTTELENRFFSTIIAIQINK